MIIAISVRNLKVRGVFDNISQASRVLGIDRGNISKLVNGYVNRLGSKSQSIGGYYFINLDVERGNLKALEKIEEIATIVKREMDKTFNERFKEKLLEINRKTVFTNKDKIYV